MAPNFRLQQHKTIRKRKLGQRKLKIDVLQQLTAKVEMLMIKLLQQPLLAQQRLAKFKGAKALARCDLNPPVTF